MDILFIGHSLVEFFDWQKRFPAHRVANLGVAGETVEGLLGRISKISRAHPSADLIFIMAGFNNVASDDFGFVTPYGNILENLSTAYPGAGIFVHSLLPNLLAGIPVESILRANALLRELAGKMGAEFLDIYPLFLEQRDIARKEYFLDDGVHLNDRGYGIWSRLIEEIILHHRP